MAHPKAHHTTGPITGGGKVGGTQSTLKVILLLATLHVKQSFEPSPWSGKQVEPALDNVNILRHKAMRAIKPVINLATSCCYSRRTTGGRPTGRPVGRPADTWLTLELGGNQVAIKVQGTSKTRVKHVQPFNRANE